MTELPSDIPLFDILPRLPVKSLCRFMCVCKQWHTFLTTPMFVKMHLDHITKDKHLNHPKKLFFSYTKPWSFRTIDCEAPHNGLTASRSLPFQVTSDEKFLVITSLNGLVCIGIYKPMLDNYSNLILWNPSTGDYKTLSKANSHDDCYMKTYGGGTFGLYYIDDDYKLLRVTSHRESYIYSLKSDSWRKVESTTNDLKHITFIPNERWKQGILLNEKLYFFKQRNRFLRSCSIIRFDLKIEKFVEIASPSFNGIFSDKESFTVLRGCIHLGMVIRYNFYANIELWRMDGDGDWTKVINYNPMFPLNTIGIPMHFMRNENWFVWFCRKGLVYKVDMEKHTKETCFVYADYFNFYASTGNYIETFVSPLPNAIANQ